MGRRAAARAVKRRELPAAPPASRLYAYVIDWALGGIVSGLPAVLAFAALRRDGSMLGTLYDFEATGYPQAVGVAVAVACLACAVAYFVVVPWLVWPGQTPGKRVAKLRVVGPGDATVGLGRLLVRQVLVGLVLEGSGFVAARYLRELAVLITRVDVNFYWEWGGPRDHGVVGRAGLCAARAPGASRLRGRHARGPGRGAPARGLGAAGRASHGGAWLARTAACPCRLMPLTPSPFILTPFATS